MKAIICFAKWPPTAGFFPGNGPYPAAAWSQGNVLKRRCGGKYAKSSAKNSSLPISRHGAFGHQETIYMIYLIFDCVSANRDVTINEEFDDYAWVKAEDLKNYDLNAAPRVPLSLKGLL